MDRDRDRIMDRIIVTEIECGEYDSPSTWGEHVQGGRVWEEYWTSPKGKKKVILTDSPGEVRLYRYSMNTGKTFLRSVDVKQKE